MDPSDEEAYARLVSIYEEQKDTVSLTNLVEGMTDERIRDIYQDYMPVEVKASQPPGTYEEWTTVELYTDGSQMCSIYYTTDGTDPMTKRNLYKTGIELAEGTTTIRAVAVNEKRDCRRDQELYVSSGDSAAGHAGDYACIRRIHRCDKNLRFH